MPDIPQNIPPQVLQALQQQQQGMSGGDITNILAQLAEMSPDELANALQQLGVQVQPDQLVDAAQNWLESAGDKQTGASADEEADTEGADRTYGVDPADQGDEEAGEPPAQQTPQEEQDEGDGEDAAALPPNAQPTSYSPQTQMAGTPPAPMQVQQAPMQGAPAAMPVPPGGRIPPAAAMRGAATGAGSTMDDLISAAMMQQAAGNPNAAVPMPRMKRPKMPSTPTSLGNMRTQNPASTRSSKRG